MVLVVLGQWLELVGKMKAMYTKSQLMLIEIGQGGIIQKKSWALTQKDKHTMDSSHQGILGNVHGKHKMHKGQSKRRT